MTNQKKLIPFPFVDELSEKSLTDLQENTKEFSFNKGDIVIQKGQKISGVYLVKSGSLRFFALDRNGNEKPIDILNAGEICVFSTNSVLKKLVFPVWVTVDSNSAEIFSIPAPTFIRIYKSEPYVREFILEAMSKRIYSMISLVEETATYDIGSQINCFLVKSCPENKTINISHQDIANRLGTAREVVSRHLKSLEAAGLVRLGRLKIDILSPQKLANILPKKAM